MRHRNAWPRSSWVVAASSLVLAASAIADHPADVQCFGALKGIIHEGRLEGRVRLTTALVRPHAYALGAMAHLDGEFLILDGHTRVSRPDDRGGVASTSSVAEKDSAALMVLAYVPAWRSALLARAIPLSALGDTLARRAPGFGLSRSGPFPFLVEGRVSGLRWHVADGRKLAPGPSTHEKHAKAAVTGASDTATVSLLGFYSDHHIGIFLHHGLNVHVHVLLPNGIAAHVDEVTVSPGATLRLPAERWRAADSPGGFPGRIHPSLTRRVTPPL